MQKKIAIIDIGTNSFILLIATIENTEIKDIQQFFRIPRLGENLALDGTISNSSIQKAKQALYEFKQIIYTTQVDEVYPVATAVLREANNKESAKQELEEAIGCEIKILTGDEEARYSFIGAAPQNGKCIVIDVGGGSTEIIFGQDQKITFSQSFPIGATKIKTLFFNDQIDQTKIELAKRHIKEIINSEPFHESNYEKLIGVGGTITTLAKISQNLETYDAEKINDHIISFHRNIEIFQSLIKMNSLEISEKFKINLHRADILTSGQIIYIVLQEIFKHQPIYVSINGLRFGILKDFLNKYS